MTKSPQELLGDAISEALTEKDFDNLDEKCKAYIRELVNLINTKFCQKMANQSQQN